MTESDSHLVRVELAQLEKLETLEEGETLRDIEEVWRRSGWARARGGVVVLTDSRVLLSSTRPILGRTRTESIPLESIESAEVFDSPKWGETRGALALEKRDESGGSERIELENIPGGPVRAEQIVQSILRQRDSSQGGS